LSERWPRVRLGDVLQPIRRREAVDPSKEYSLLGVRLDGKGPFLRETVAGSQTAASALNRVEPGDFIYSRLFAWRGAFGVVDPVLDGCYVSGEFPTFLPVAERIDVRFLRYWFWLPETLRRVEEDCSGSTPLTRNRYKEQFFLTLAIPLPPLAEQRRIVARIEELEARIAESQTLRRTTVQDGEALLRSILAMDTSAVPTPMSDLLHLRQPDVIVQASDHYQFAGVYSFGRGVFKAQCRSGMEFAYPRLTRLRAGDFVYPKLMAWEGALGVTPAECDGCVVSTEFPVFQIDSKRVLPEVLDVHFRNPGIWPALSGASTGTNVRRRRLNPSDFLKYQMPLPARETQIRLRAVHNRMSVLRQQQNTMAAEIDALLPAVLDRAFKGEL
jgi:type I restriction enzyme, S subunit